MSRGVGVLSSAVVLVALLIGAPSAFAQAQDPRPLLAVLVPQTGDFAGIGDRVLRVVAMASQQVPSIRFQIYDTAGDDGPLGAFDTAVADGAMAILGPIGDQECELVAEAAEQEGIVTFLLSGAHEIEDGRDYVFRLRTSPRDQAEVLGAAVTQNYDLESYVVLAPDDRFGEDAVEGFVEGVAGAGGVIWRVVRYEVDEPDVGDAVELLVGRRTERLDVPSNPWDSPPSTRVTGSRGSRAQPDAVFIPEYAPMIASILPFLRFHEWITDFIDESVQLLGTSSWAGYELQFVGDLAAGAMVVQIFHADDVSSEVEAFTLTYEDSFGERPLSFDGESFDAAMFAMNALSRLARGTTDRQRVLWLLDEYFEHEGVCGSMWLDEEGGVVRDIGLWEVDGGGYLFPLGTINVPRLP